MVKHECEYLSSCCDTEIIYGTDIDFDEGGAFGVCSHCHEYNAFYDQGHTPWDYDPLKKPVPKHDCDFVSECCGARPFGELDHYLTGFCGGCHDGSGFECEVDENCENNTRALLAQSYNNR